MGKFKLQKGGFGKYCFYKAVPISNKEASELERDGQKTYGSRKEALENANKIKHD